METERWSVAINLQGAV